MKVFPGRLFVLTLTAGLVVGCGGDEGPELKPVDVPQPAAPVKGGKGAPAKKNMPESKGRVSQ